MNIRRIIVCTIILLVCFGVTINSYRNFEGTKVEEIKEKPSKDSRLTFHVQDFSGSYTEYTSGKFPSGSYQINQTKTTCVDVYGNKITPALAYVGGSVVIRGSKTAYCEVYLDKVLYTATFYVGSKKNSTVSLPSATWTATWTMPNAKQYCITKENTSINCSWSDLPSSATTGYSNTLTLTSTGSITYYFYVKDAVGQIASDSDTVTVTEIAPKCTLAITGNGTDVILNMTPGEGVTEYGMKSFSLGIPESNITKTYDGANSMLVTTTNIEIIGFVKNAAGTEGRCIAYLEEPTVPSNECQASSSGGSSGTCVYQTIGCGPAYTGNGGQTCNNTAGAVLASYTVGSCSAIQNTSCSNSSAAWCVRTQCTCTGGGGSSGGYKCTKDSQNYPNLSYCKGYCSTVTCRSGYKKTYGTAVAVCYQISNS